MLGSLFRASCCSMACLVMLLLPQVSPSQGDQQKSKLLLVSFDGFRWDYIDRVPTPNFHVLMDEGVRVERVEPAYISKTLPDHYSMVTGLHAESHGIVANEMFDPVLNLSFVMETESAYEPRWWEGAVPLWVTNQGAGGRSGAAMWPGSDVEIHGVYPTRYLPYNASVPFEARVEQMLEWFSASAEEAVDLGLLYWEEPDVSGHSLGPENPDLDAVLVDVDEKLGYLRAAMKRAGLYEEVNLVVTSDHGMAQQAADNIIELDQYVAREMYTWVDKSPVVGILPKTGKLEEVYSLLADAHPRMKVYKREEIPERFHYRHNIRIMPIIVEADEGWTIMQNRSGIFMLGNHGYDNASPKMHHVFVARGPAFRRGYSKPTMRSVDLYPLMCDILSVPPLPNNGSLDNVRDLLALPEPPPPPPPPPPPRPAPVAVTPSPAPGMGGTSYAAAIGSLFGVALVMGFLVMFVRQVTLRQVPSLPLQSREMSQPLLQEDLHL